ncbi:MAG: DUF151 domain-containing protein [Treponema sp.]|jgi:bifunctional DNase/RNase|nr:DUF151 domain-containing protein [Treponema sp.]
MTDGMLEAEIWSVARTGQGNVILLRPLGSDTVVPVFTGHAEAHAILLGLGDMKAKRPLTCDVLLEVSRHLGLSLFRVEVYEIREDAFYTRLFFSGREYSKLKPLIIDSRPSDAIALAIREKCTIYIASRVLKLAGVPAEVFTGDGVPSSRETASGTPAEGNPLAAKRRRLQTDLELAVGNEAYEQAAEIRDLLILLDQQLGQERQKAP